MRRILVILICLTCANSVATAAPGDAAKGRALAQNCLACHGTDTVLGTPPYHVPRLFDQNAAYILRALKAYASGARANDIMHDQASALSAKDMNDLAAYFAGQRSLPPPPNSSGAIPQKVVQVCSACHGETGLASMPEVAVLSGQHADYLKHALTAYASGERRNPVMAVFARKLTAADRQAIVDYFSRLGVLKAQP